MFLPKSLWTSALALGALVIPATAADNATPPTTPTPPPTITRTFLFPAAGLAASEMARVSVVNIAPASHTGTKASCTGEIGFTDATGAAVGKGTAFTNVGTSQIATGDLDGSTLTGSARNEFQGSVKLTINLGAGAPCSLLMTLEIFDKATAVTHSIVTAAVEEPVAIPGVGIGRAH